NRASVAQNGSHLAALDTSDFFMICADGKNRHAVRAAQFANVICVAVQDGPAHTSSSGSAGDLWHSRSAHRLEDDRIRLSAGGLDHIQQLLTLRDRIVARIDYFQTDPKFPHRALSRGSLLDLVVVVVGGERYENAQFLHGLAPFSNDTAI